MQIINKGFIQAQVTKTSTDSLLNFLSIRVHTIPARLEVEGAFLLLLSALSFVSFLQLQTSFFGK